MVLMFKVPILLGVGNQMEKNMEHEMEAGFVQEVSMGGRRGLNMEEQGIEVYFIPQGYKGTTLGLSGNWLGLRQHESSRTSLA